MTWFAASVIATALCTTSITVTAGAVNTEAETVVDKLQFPEGPLFVNDRLHWVEYASNRLMRLNGETRTVLHEQEGCGHNGLSLSPNNQLVVICYESNEILYLDLDGNVVERINADVNGEPFNHPNDIVFTDKGGAYFTTSGPFGKLLFSSRYVRVASCRRRDIHTLRWKCQSLYPQDPCAFDHQFRNNISRRQRSKAFASR